MHIFTITKIWCLWILLMDLTEIQNSPMIQSSKIYHIVRCYSKQCFNFSYLFVTSFYENWVLPHSFCHGSPSVILKCKLRFILSKSPIKVSVFVAKTKYWWAEKKLVALVRWFRAAMCLMESVTSRKRKSEETFLGISFLQWTTAKISESVVHLPYPRNFQCKLCLCFLAS